MRIQEHIYKLPSPIVLVSLVLCLATGAWANLRYSQTAAGSFSSSVIDTNGDGVPGATGILEGQSTFGALTIHFFTEFDVFGAGPNPDVCPETGFIELPLVASWTIHSYKNGDQLYFQTLEEVFCGDLASGEFYWNEELEVIGGTGRFANAVGKMRVSGGGNSLAAGADGVTNFGAITLGGKGEIKLNPK